MSAALQFNVNRGNRKLFEFIRATIEHKLPEWIPDNLPMHMPTWAQMVSAEAS